MLQPSPWALSTRGAAYRTYALPSFAAARRTPAMLELTEVRKDLGGALRVGPDRCWLAGW